MRNREGKPRAARIQELRAEIAAGTYLTPEKLDGAVERLGGVLRRLRTPKGASHAWARKMLADLVAEPPGDIYCFEAALDCVQVALAAFRSCPAGHPQRFRDLATVLIALNMGEVVDYDLIQTESMLPGGWADAELPLCTERLGCPDHYLWRDWQRRFDVRCLLIEAKNWRRPVGPLAVAQTRDNLLAGRRGRLAMLVSRSGFSPGARKRLSEVAKSGDQLILPLSRSDLEAWAMCETLHESMQFLRRKETMLVQAN